MKKTITFHEDWGRYDWAEFHYLGKYTIAIYKPKEKYKKDFKNYTYFVDYNQFVDEFLTKQPILKSTEELSTEETKIYTDHLETAVEVTEEIKNRLIEQSL